MKILLVAPFKDNSTGLAQFPPIGLGYVANALKSAGYTEVRILDCVLEGHTLDGFLRYLRDLSPDVVGINSWSVSVREVAESLKAIKKLARNVTTVIGGPHPSAIGEKTLENFPDADYAFKGEAEVGAPMLMDFVSGRTSTRLTDIPGLLWRENGIVKSNPQSLEKDLDQLGMPSWELIGPGRYACAGTLIQKRTACIITTRGCPFPCTFCSASITAGRIVRKRSIEHVISEMRLLDKRFGIKRFVVFDENITLLREHIMAFCRAVIKEAAGYAFELPNGIRLDTLDMEVLTLMRRAGFSERVAVGIESGSERVLKFMKKGLKKDEIREKVALLKKAGFRPIGYFIVGFPTETIDEIEETVRFAIELKLFRAGFMPFHPLPGTASFEYLVKKGEITEDFDFSILSTDNVAYAPEGMTKEELERIRKRAILRFNLRPRVLWDYMRDYNSMRFMLKKFRNIFMKKKGVYESPLTGAA